MGIKDQLMSIGDKFADQVSQKTEGAAKKAEDAANKAQNAGKDAINSANQVIIFEHKDFGGAAQKLREGKYNVGSLSFGNDSLSSVRVPAGFKVTLYEHADFKGATMVITKDTAYVGNGFNDKTSSIIVERV